MSTFTIPSVTIGGNNVSVTTEPSGQINIALPGSQFDVPIFTLPASSIIVSASMATDFYLQQDTLITSSQTSISTVDAVSKQELTFWLTDVTFPYLLIDSGSSALIYSTSVGIPTKVITQFNGTNWVMSSLTRLSPVSGSVTSQDTMFETFGLTLDIDPNNSISSLTSGYVNTITNIVSTVCPLTGIGHSPK